MIARAGDRARALAAEIASICAGLRPGQAIPQQAHDVAAQALAAERELERLRRMGSADRFITGETAERVYIEDYGDELVCPVCFALVPNDYTDQHERWHEALERAEAER